MPEFSEYVDTQVEITVTVSDFIDKCTTEDLEELIEELIDRGVLNIRDCIKSLAGIETGVTVQEYEFDKAIDKISRNRLQLTNEEDIILQTIASRLV
jgi:hypothetical protein